MRLLKLLAIIGIPFLFSGSSLPTENLSCKEIVSLMIDSLKNIKTQQFDLKSTERGANGQLFFAESHIKINSNPKKIYFKSILKGTEVLWVQGSNKGNAIVHTPYFSFFNLDLDPYGSLMRKDQHHTIFDLGFQRIGIMIATTIVKAPKDFDKHFASAGILVWNNIDCYQLLINFPEYKYVEYIVGKGETVTTIAEKLNTSDYKIRYKNALSSYFGQLKEGQKLLIPTPYCNKVIIYIDKKKFIPISMKVYDDEGLYEGYEFFNVRINHAFSPDEFSKNYPGYKF